MHDLSMENGRDSQLKYYENNAYKEMNKQGKEVIQSIKSMPYI